MENKNIAKVFVDSLVPGKFQEAKQYIADGCHYQYGDRKLEKDAIVESFIENHHNASRKLDLVEYLGAEIESEEDDYVTIVVQDKMKKGSKEFLYKDRLIIRIEGDKISEIIHKPYPKERQKLKAFLDKVDVKL